MFEGNFADTCAKKMSLVLMVKKKKKPNDQADVFHSSSLS
jgi:hypothetical protein